MRGLPGRLPVILGMSGLSLRDDEAALFTKFPPTGIILFGRNIAEPGQLASLMAALRGVLPADAIFMVDQEGGRVARLRAPHWPDLPPAASLADNNAAFAHGLALGRMVAAAGFNMAAAPVLDLHQPGASDVIGDRALSAAPEIVAALGGHIAAGIMQAGVMPVMKHIPGHGRALVDSHLSLPRIPAGVDLTADFHPFQANNTLPWAMTAHILYEAYDTLNPATLSARVIAEVIRGIIGFTGRLMSDDLAMGALSGTPATRAQAALAAGCDVALYCPGDMAGNSEILMALAND